MHCGRARRSTSKELQMGIAFNIRGFLRRPQVHRTYIGFIEQGKRNPSIGNIHKIAVALKVDIKKLF
jgi:transcriptional regulator with XRE-family HTH domain